MNFPQSDIEWEVKDPINSYDERKRFHRSSAPYMKKISSKTYPRASPLRMRKARPNRNELDRLIYKFLNYHHHYILKVFYLHPRCSILKVSYPCPKCYILKVSYPCRRCYILKVSYPCHRCYILKVSYPCPKCYIHKSILSLSQVLHP